MTRIHVHPIGDNTYAVTINADTSTTHNVTVDHDYYLRLTGGHTTVERLLEKSFEFLLEREPNTSILRSFDLPVISQYFPEYEQTIKERLF